MQEPYPDRTTEGGLWIWNAIAAVVAFFVALEQTRNYDYFWHLATGRWILENGRIPRLDPFSLTGEGREWVNLEWLFDVQLYVVQSLVGHVGISIVVALGVAAVAATLTSRSPLNVAAAASLISICLVAASFRIDPRPETASVAPFLVIVVLALSPRPDLFRVLVATAVTVLWVNTHPSALLAPLLIGAGLVGDLLARRASWPRLFQLAGVSAALLCNPWGAGGIAAPFHLAEQLARGAGFENLEWRWSDPALFPLFWILLALSLLSIVLTRDRHDLTRVLIFAGLAILAVRYGRNQIYFLSALPLLVVLPPRERVRSWTTRILVLSATLIVGWIYAVEPQRGGVDPDFFPVSAARLIEDERLEGNIYNPDQFGGYLIWHFPDRRVLTDGRNELNREFIPRLGRALRDQREWEALLREYEIDIAVEEHRPPIEVVDARTGRTTTVPASLAFFPPDRWALVAADDVAMLFLRRGAFPAETIERLEIER